MKIALLLLLMINITAVNAASFRNGSISLLYGDNYVVEPAQQQTVTFEYIAKWDRWDMFMFVDYKNYRSAGNSYYGEFSPRFRLIQFSQNNLISKLSLVSTFERGKNGVEANLFGLGVDLNTRMFRFLTMNFYQRNNPDIAGKGYQLTTAWAHDFKLADMPFVFDGYFDWTFATQESAENFHFNPQIKLDMKKWLGGTQQWYLGFEYDYWNNKYGLADSANFNTDQNTFSFLAKWHF